LLKVFNPGFDNPALYRLTASPMDAARLWRKEIRTPGVHAAARGATSMSSCPALYRLTASPMDAARLWRKEIRTQASMPRRGMRRPCRYFEANSPFSG